jgi:D-sedoheptulose 7-phosphate isomerase
MGSNHAPEIKRYLEASRDAVEAALADASFVEAVTQATHLVIDALRAGKKVLIAGNGGSAADAQHLATELMVRYYIDRAALPAIALGTDASANTAIGNDLGFESLFSRQVAALGNEGDVFIALSTSGRSPNILAACRTARTRHMRVIGFTGTNGGSMQDICEILVRVPSDKTPLIQQTYMVAGHALCEIVERELAKAPG